MNVTMNTVSALLTAALALAPAAPAAPATPAPDPPAVGVPRFTDLRLGEPVRDLLPLGNRVWLTSGDALTAWSSDGRRLPAAVHLPGAAGLAADPATGALFVAVGGGSRVVEIDPETSTITRSFSTAPCPSGLAVAGGRLFHSTGCAGDPGAVGSVDLADGTSGPAVGGSYPEAPRLLGGGSTLAVESGSAAAVLSVAPDGTTTRRGSVPVTGNVTGDSAGHVGGDSAGHVGGDIGGDGGGDSAGHIAGDSGGHVGGDSAGHSAGDVALAPDGSEVAITTRGGIQRYDALIQDLPHLDFHATGVDALAYGPDGARLAGATGEKAYVFGRTADQLLSRNAGFGRARVVPGTLRFPSSGPWLFALATDPAGRTFLMAAAADHVSRAFLLASVARPAGWNRPFTVTVSKPSRPHSTVAVTATRHGGTAEYRGMTDAHGKATLVLRERYSGTLLIRVAGTLTSGSPETTRPYLVPSALRTALGGPRTRRNHYARPADVVLNLTTWPSDPVRARITMEARLHGRWQVAAHGAPRSTGHVAFRPEIYRLRREVTYRFVSLVPAGVNNAESNVETSETFVID